MESFATAYPVMFHDGEQDHDKGLIGIYPNLSFARFQAQMGRQVGVPANQLSIALVCRRSPVETDKRQKLHINEGTNFGIVLNQHHPSRDRGCHFYASVKKSKKERRGGGGGGRVANRRGNGGGGGGDEDETLSSSPTSILQRAEVGSPAENELQSNIVLLKRGEAVSRGLLAQEQDQRKVEGFEVRDGDEDQATAAAVVAVAAACCERSSGEDREFHACVRDARVLEWRASPFGPIARPIKA